MACSPRTNAAPQAPAGVSVHPSFVVSVAGPEHVDGLCRLEEALFTCDCMSRHTIRRFLRIPTACLLVAVPQEGCENASAPVSSGTLAGELSAGKGEVTVEGAAEGASGQSRPALPAFDRDVSDHDVLGQNTSTKHLSTKHFPTGQAFAETVSPEGGGGDGVSAQNAGRKSASPRRTVLADGSLEVAGYALVLFRKNSTRARLYSLAVDTDMQGKGVGKALMAAVEEQVRAHGRVRVGLEVRTDNRRAQTLYESLGFVRTGKRFLYYEDGTDALVMEKTLEG